MAEWFEVWFNTDEYLNVYHHRDEADAEKLTHLILANLNLKKNAEIIDLACGPGRHSVLFAKNGFNVTAVDLSEKLLKAAKTSAMNSGISINFVNADLRKICLGSKFDLAVSLFTSFGYFETDDKNFSLFENASALLKDNGNFVLDYFNSNYIRNNLVPYSEVILNGEKIVQERRIIGKRVIKDIRILKNNAGKRFVESVRMYSDSELISELERHGLKILKIFGDYDGSKFDLKSSQRIIIISGK